MPTPQPTLEDILEHVNRYLADGAIEDAISRLKELQEELVLTMEALGGATRSPGRAIPMPSEPPDRVGAAVRERCIAMARQRVVLACGITRDATLSTLSSESKRLEDTRLRDLLGESLRLLNIAANDPGHGDIDWLFSTPRGGP